MNESKKMKGNPRDSPEARVSKTLSWILRHGALSEKLEIRPDGYVRVSDILASRKFKELNFETIENVVKDDHKQRYRLVQGPDPRSPSSGDIWWIRANQGHSIKSVNLDLQHITSVSDIPAGIAVHGTNLKAWPSIAQQGLSKMSRNHIHLAQGVPGSGVISGMRNSSQIFIYIDIQKALDAGIEFFLSDNGVILTPGSSKGYLDPSFFRRVERVQGKNRIPLPEWDRADPQFAELERKASHMVEGTTTSAADASSSQASQSDCATVQEESGRIPEDSKTTSPALEEQTEKLIL